ncbi:MAG: phosphatidylglycerol lysyltransferase domain-containing protein [Deltaproteobacteria bacterium]|nr:phosphatidylglycerol lysyltransferase domain-containing protein [Deltaproteobacteria bacterium]MCL5792643.1 phosphatidylglycerol lysyltransferase domain-containing protein [Deltaproteobacteria bacterium]
MDQIIRLTRYAESIPVFPEFAEIDIKMKPYFDRILRLNPPQASEYDFTNMFIWRHFYKFKAGLVNESICIKGLDKDGKGFFMFIAKDIESYVDTVKHIVSFYKNTGDEPIQLFRVEERFIEPLQHAFPDIRYEEDRDNYDYIYLASDLIELRGRKFDGKRNHIKKFKNHYTYTYERITDQLINSCIFLTDKWYSNKGNPLLKDDVIATKEALINFNTLGLTGGTIIVDDNVIAFCIAEGLNPDTAVGHIEKFDPSYEGIPQVISNEFCIHELSHYKYINREQDLGHEGLRKAKLSYHPVQILKKYRVFITPE